MNPFRPTGLPERRREGDRRLCRGKNVTQDGENNEIEAIQVVSGYIGRSPSCR